jgi:hypothetical protein
MTVLADARVDRVMLFPHPRPLSLIIYYYT